MNKSNLKSYAPKARVDFIAAVTARANLLGINENGASEATVRGEIAIIEGREWPSKVAYQRDILIDRISKHGFKQAMDEIAYTWFNRFAALRYMELHDYLDHGWRLLSSRDGGLPEILGHASEVTFAGLSPEVARGMQLSGNQDNELYKLLIVAQCNELSKSMPFLFEHIDDETELLLPENLLRTDSIVSKLVESVPEEDWENIESIGWLYQYYISERKNQVIGKVVQSEDIPAATQLFTPNWIVKYLVQNSVGRLWSLTNPATSLKSSWEYYTELPDQQESSKLERDRLVYLRKSKDGGSLDPETIRVIDPACGSGHILVEAYEILKSIYLERGYRLRDIPRLILEKNLYGIDIDDRAAQLSGFALLMKARADDRRILQDAPALNVIALIESKNLNADELVGQLAPFGVDACGVRLLLSLFGEAKTYGSLLKVPPELSALLPSMRASLDLARSSGDLYGQAAGRAIAPLALQAELLDKKYDAVVANPPYMGRKSMTGELKRYAAANYPQGRPDLFSMFIVRCSDLCGELGSIGLMTPFVWMFLSSYEEIRDLLTNKLSITTLVQPEYHTFFESANVPICAFVCDNSGLDSRGNYFDLTTIYGSDAQAAALLEIIKGGDSPLRYHVDCHDFAKIPSSPIAYWTSEKLRMAVHDSESVSDYAVTKQGLITGKNDLFLRRWHEVSSDATGRLLESRLQAQESGKRWFPCVKGGAFRKWYGNNEYVVDWEDDGARIRSFTDADGDLLSRPQNLDYFFKEGMSWSTLTVGTFSMRWCPPGTIFESKGSMCFPHSKSDGHYLLAFFNTKLVNAFLRASSPTLDYHEGPVAKLPFRIEHKADVEALAAEAIQIAKSDWDAYETSNDFQGNPLVLAKEKFPLLKDAWSRWREQVDENISRMVELESRNNKLFIDSFGLGDELDAAVDREQITLTLPERDKDCQRLVSYAVGCMMGRYSLDRPGIVFARDGSKPIVEGDYETFPADADGIIPLTDMLWFDDDAGKRLREFIGEVWGPGTLEENLSWLAAGLGQKANETPDDTIRRYLSDKFYKDHLQVFKRRPIYWHFSSGKQRAFQALVYIHRYNEGTLSRMRSEYIVPLGAKFLSRIEMLEADFDSASSSAMRTKIQKQIEALRKKNAELLAYDEKLRQFADMRIALDLNDGVKSNYGKFGDLLSDVKAIAGAADE
jgi:hypothetical protein